MDTCLDCNVAVANSNLALIQHSELKPNTNLFIFFRDYKIKKKGKTVHVYICNKKEIKGKDSCTKTEIPNRRRMQTGNNLVPKRHYSTVKVGNGITPAVPRLRLFLNEATHKKKSIYN